jgi:hypothetical protein
MVSGMLQLRCAGGGPDVTAADHFKAAAATVVGTLARVIPLSWAIRRFGKAPYLVAFVAVSWLVPYLFGQRYTTFKGRSGGVQAILIGGPSAIVIAVVLAAVWLSTR